MKKTLALMIVTGIVASTSSQASVLAYEGFDYSAGALNGQNGGQGFASSWSASSSDGTNSVVASGTLWNGTLTSVAQTGIYAGSPTQAIIGGSPNGNSPDQIWGSRQLDPAVTATFINGNTTWVSYAMASNFANNANYTGGMVALGQGIITNRGNVITGGPAVGIGVFTSGGVFRSGSVTPPSGPVYFGATVWDTSFGTIPLSQAVTSQEFNPYYSAVSSPTGLPRQAYVGIARIDWTATGGTINVAAFLDGATLTETAFNAAAVSQSFTAAPSTFNMFSFAGARYNVDEFRVATTFSDVTGIAAVPETSVGLLSLLGVAALLRRRRS